MPVAWFGAILPSTGLSLSAIMAYGGLDGFLSGIIAQASINMLTPCTEWSEDVLSTAISSAIIGAGTAGLFDVASKQASGIAKSIFGRRVNNLLSGHTTIRGRPDVIHEGSQAIQFGNLIGGGLFDFDAVPKAQQGIEGIFFPSNLDGSPIPVSLKDASNKARLIGVFREIRKNAKSVAQTQYSGNTVLHVNISQFSKQNVLDFVKVNNQNIFPQDGVFSGVILDASDGQVFFNHLNQIIE